MTPNPTRIERARAALGDLRSLVVEACGEAGPSRQHRCCFHEERTPSLRLYANGTRWKCAGCGADGDSIDFFARRRGVSVAQALDLILVLDPGVPTRKATPAAAPVPASRGKTSASPAAPQQIDPRDVWRRARLEGKSAGAGAPAIAYLAKRLGNRPDLARALLEAGEVGVATASGAFAQSSKWTASRAAENYALTLPLWACPRPGTDTITIPLDVCDVALRHVGPGEAPGGRKILRTPGNGGVVPFYGYPPAMLAEADAATLYLVEGALDYLSLRAAGRPVIGIFSYDYAAKSAAILRGEIAALRTFGVGGPARVVLADQADVSSTAGMDRIAHELVTLPGLRVERTTLRASIGAAA